MSGWFGRFGEGFKEQLNSVGGIVTLIGTVLAIVGVFVQGTLQTVLIVIAATILVPVLVISVVRAWPAKMMSPQEAETKDAMPLRDLESISPSIPKLGIIGWTGVGKSSLRDLLLQRPPDKTETNTLRAYVGAIFQRPVSYAAVLDGKGESYTHQFEVAVSADILCVMIDHSLVPSELVSPDRINQHKAFGKQLRDQLTEKWNAKTPTHRLPIHMLLNKRDEWARADDASQDLLKSFLESECEEWRKLNFVSVVTLAEHSNSIPSDVVNLRPSLKALCENRVPL